MEKAILPLDNVYVYVYTFIMATKEKYTKHLHILITETQLKELKYLSFNTGRSIAELIRIFIDEIDKKKLEKERGEE